MDILRKGLKVSIFFSRSMEEGPSQGNNSSKAVPDASMLNYWRYEVYFEALRNDMSSSDKGPTMDMITLS